MLVIGENHIDEMIAHARRDAPDEACGLLAGRAGRIEKVYPMRNEGLAAEVVESSSKVAEERTRCPHCRRVIDSEQAEAAFTDPSRRPVSYFMDPRQLFEVAKDIREAGLKQLGIYHSHPDTSAEPSETDIAMAFDRESAYFIVSLADPESPVVKAYHIKRTEEAHFTVEKAKTD